MTKQVRTALLVLVALGSVAVIQTLMNTRTCWSAETKASVWVAIGTGLLAVATFWSIIETNLVIRAEDRRHQQSLVPILALVSDVTLDPRNMRYRLTLVNKGKGPAFNVLVNAEGACDLRWVRLSEAPPQSGSAYVQSVDERRNPFTFAETFQCPLVTDREEVPVYSNGLIQPLVETEAAGLYTNNAGIASFDVWSAQIDYADMFGNNFKVVYSDFANGQFEFIMPDSIRARNAQLDRLIRRMKQTGT